MSHSRFLIRGNGAVRLPAWLAPWKMPPATVRSDGSMT